MGEPGVGKIAIIEGLALRILSSSIPEKLWGKKVIDTLFYSYMLHSESRTNYSLIH